MLQSEPLSLCHLVKPQDPTMHSPNPIGSREADILKIAESQTDLGRLREHLKEIVGGAAFRGSHRSAQFLTHIVEESIAGKFESLKERVIGAELFGRSPAYDTGEDAIVRVTASEVRKRLLQHYGRYGASSRFRISLPLGSYVPEIVDELPSNSAARRPESDLRPTIVPDKLPAAHQPSIQQVPATVAPIPALLPEERDARAIARRYWLPLVLLVIASNLVWVGVVWAKLWPTRTAPLASVPWGVLFSSTRATHLITSDPTIVNVQEMTGSPISVSDYANHHYIPEPNKLSPEQFRFAHSLLGGNTSSAAAVDTPIAVSIANLAQSAAGKLDVHAARSLRFADLKTDDNFIFLGSPRSDPWVSLFNDQLDFAFAFDQSSGQEYIRNVHPRPHESATYNPTAQGWATGQSFAILALVQNPDQDGHVFLLAGANGEGTEAAGKLATDLPRLDTILKNCGLRSSPLFTHFELLLRFNAMAGSPNNIDVLACHLLSSRSARRP